MILSWLGYFVHSTFPYVKKLLYIGVKISKLNELIKNDTVVLVNKFDNRFNLTIRTVSYLVGHCMLNLSWYYSANTVTDKIINIDTSYCLPSHRHSIDDLMEWKTFNSCVCSHAIFMFFFSLLLDSKLITEIWQWQHWKLASTKVAYMLLMGYP